MAALPPPSQASLNIHRPHYYQGALPPHRNEMNDPQPLTTPPLRNGMQNNASGDFQAVDISTAPAFQGGNGPLPSNRSQNQLMNGQSRNPPGMGAHAGFEGPRSPPGGKNTSHVPCKFFRQGACQAGKACPFSHSLDPATETAPCKYFAKGNCKFGAKCALAHILPDGRRVNKPGLVAGTHLNLGGRIPPQAYHNHDSALANSLLSQQANMTSSPYSHQYQYSNQGDLNTLHSPHLNNGENIPSIETGLSSYPGSNYGSPRDETRLPMSPLNKGISTLDAPLPASFDSQGISWIARHGPVAASVPSKFGLDSPPHSLSQKLGQPSEALKSLHDSAFGNDHQSKFNASSPPPGNEDYIGQRIMHSQRYSRPKMLSASLPRPNAGEEWDGSFAFEEDFIPNSLHELLTPQEKMRRFSRNEEESGSQHLSMSGFGTPGDSSSKVGSPSTASPSRFGALFSRQQQQKKEEESLSSTPGLGHVGSPLRNSSLHPGASPSLRGINRPNSGDVSPFFASPPRQSSMSMISQQLQRARLARAESSESASGLHHPPGPTRHLSSGNPNGRLDRAVSSSSIGLSVPSIDEEHSDTVFSMEEEEDNRRYSGGWNYPVGGRSPRIGPIGDRRSSVATQEGKDGKDYDEGWSRFLSTAVKSAPSEGEIHDLRL